jgi:hypothetical protein
MIGAHEVSISTDGASRRDLRIREVWTLVASIPATTAATRGFVVIPRVTTFVS